MDFIGIYQNYIVFVIYFLLIAIIITFHFINFKFIKKQFININKKSWIFLLFIFLSGFILRFFVFPHYHQMYIDEPMYLEYAKNINQKLKLIICETRVSESLEDYCWFSLKPIGWPFLISLAFKIFGLNNYVALYFSSLLGSLSVVLIFLFSYLLFKNEKIALWSAFLLAFTPIYVIWSNSAETNNPSLFFVLLTAIFFILYLRTKEKPILALAVLLLMFTVLVRFETIILAVLFSLAYIRFSQNPKDQFSDSLNLYYPLIIIVSLAGMVILEGFFIGFFRKMFYYNFLDFYFLTFFEYLKAASFNYIYLTFAAINLFLIEKSDKKIIALLATSFIFFFLLYLPISFESRMALIPCLFLIVLSSFSLEKLFSLFGEYNHASRIITLLIFLAIYGFSLMSVYENIYINDSANLLETQSIMQIKKEIPKNCYVISEFPVVLTSVSDLKGLRTKYVLSNPEIISALLNNDKCVYYFYDGYCMELPLSTVKYSVKRCLKMLEKFRYEKEISLKMDNKEYSLFRIYKPSGRD